MSGHSKWNNIKRKKEKTDGAKAKVFTKIGRELAVAVKEGGGPDPNTNSKLKDCVAKAKANNVPNDNIERIIKKAAGDGDDTKYENITYEGYGPNGIAVIVETLTDNRNRTGVRDDLEKKGYEFVSAEVEMVPNTYTTLTDEESITKMQRLLDALEDNDDVQNVWHNWDNPDMDD